MPGNPILCLYAMSKYTSEAPLRGFFIGMGDFYKLVFFSI
jgi:hypothetical protein